MRRKRVRCLLMPAVLGWCLTVHAAEPGIPIPEPIPEPMPEPLPADEFNDVLVRVGDGLFIAGQPSEQGLKDMAAAGVTTVVNLRTEHEMNDRSVVGFDESALAATLGLTYVHIPSGGPDTPYSAAMVDRFAGAVEAAEGKVLLHCTVAWRASHLYTAYLYRYRGLGLDEAVRHGRAVNLGTLPLEGFLGGTLSFELEATPQ